MSGGLALEAFTEASIWKATFLISRAHSVPTNLVHRGSPTANRPLPLALTLSRCVRRIVYVVLYNTIPLYPEAHTHASVFLISRPLLADIPLSCRIAGSKKFGKSTISRPFVKRNPAALPAHQRPFSSKVTCNKRGFLLRTKSTTIIVSRDPTFLSLSLLEKDTRILTS